MTRLQTASLASETASLKLTKRSVTVERMVSVKSFKLSCGSNSVALIPPVSDRTSGSTVALHQSAYLCTTNMAFTYHHHLGKVMKQVRH